jgi:hypothetical protein
MEPSVNRRQVLQMSLLGIAGLTARDTAAIAGDPEGEVLYNGIRLPSPGRHVPRRFPASRASRPT